MSLLRLFLFLPLLFTLLTGCGNLSYLSKLGWHQSSILFHSIPVQGIMEDEGVDPGIKEKIHFIQEVKRYGEEKLGLTRTKSYSKYVEVKGPVLYVITASDKDRLQPYHWSFPITGKVTYKSFFTKKEVLKEKRFLIEKGYDTFVQRAGAYSTLGWLKDPIFSSMTQWEEAALANLLLHEMTHVTLYFKDQTDFNEQVATFIGNQGAIDFLIEKYGIGSPQVVEAIHSQEDDLLFSRWIDQACRRLSDFYSKEISREEKINGRKEIFHSLSEEFKEITFKIDCSKNFDKIELNNAVVLAYRRYIHRLEKFQILYETLGNDLKRMVDFFKKIQVSKEDPSFYLEQWIKEKNVTVPAFLQ